MTASTSPWTAERLVARTVRLDLHEAPDLIALAGDVGLLFTGTDVSLAGRGEALRVDLPEGLAAAGSVDAVAEALASIVVEDEVDRPGTGPVVMGALPFDRDQAAALVVPRVLVGVTPDGGAWLTTVGVGAPPGGRLGLDALAPPAPRPSPDSFTLTSAQSHQAWCEMVAAAVDAVRGGMEKVVLAREVLVEANRPIVPTAVLARLRALYPGCMLFSVGGFVGASPELLVSRFGRTVRSHPLAGTIAHSGDPAVDNRMAAELLASAKDRREHRVVVEAVVRALAPVCEEIDVPEAPSIVSLRNVSHLGTLVQGTLAASGSRATSDPPDALSLVAALHPTPAVAGVPTEDALAYIKAVEPFDRGLYAGPVGWMDARGDGAFAVGIRSASISGCSARLVAGGGIVSDSVPEAELAETQLKLQALLAAVVRP